MRAQLGVTFACFAPCSSASRSYTRILPRVACLCANGAEPYRPCRPWRCHCTLPSSARPRHATLTCRNRRQVLLSRASQQLAAGVQQLVRLLVVPSVVVWPPRSRGCRLCVCQCPHTWLSHERRVASPRRFRALPRERPAVRMRETFEGVPVWGSMVRRACFSCGRGGTQSD